MIFWNRFEPVLHFQTELSFCNIKQKQIGVFKNPFAVLDARLANIEGLLLDIKHPEVSNKENQQKTILDTDQLMAKLGITRPTLSKWRKEKRIPFIQV